MAHTANELIEALELHCKSMQLGADHTALRLAVKKLREAQVVICTLEDKLEAICPTHTPLQHLAACLAGGAILTVGFIALVM